MGHHFSVKASKGGNSWLNLWKTDVLVQYLLQALWYPEADLSFKLPKEWMQDTGVVELLLSAALIQNLRGGKWNLLSCSYMGYAACSPYKSVLFTWSTINIMNNCQSYCTDFCCSCIISCNILRWKHKRTEKQALLKLSSPWTGWLNFQWECTIQLPWFALKKMHSSCTVVILCGFPFKCTSLWAQRVNKL